MSTPAALYYLDSNDRIYCPDCARNRCFADDETAPMGPGNRLAPVFEHVTINGDPVCFECRRVRRRIVA